MVQQVSAEKMLLMVNSVNAAASVLPKSRSTPATMKGYTGAVHAVGPVPPPHGDANPKPKANDWPISDISQICQCPSTRYERVIRRNATRTANPTTTMQMGEYRRIFRLRDAEDSGWGRGGQRGAGWGEEDIRDSQFASSSQLAE